MTTTILDPFRQWIRVPYGLVPITEAPPDCYNHIHRVSLLLSPILHMILSDEIHQQLKHVSNEGPVQCSVMESGCSTEVLLR